MTLTRKIGVVLVFLAAAPILGSIAFALFFSATASDGLFWIASNVEYVLLQELYIQSLTIRDGDDSARQRLLELTNDFRDLLQAMEEGGSQTRNGTGPSAVVLTNQLSVIGSDVDIGSDANTKRLADRLTEGLPVPPEDLRRSAAELRQIWSDIDQSFLDIARLPAGAELADDAYNRVRRRENELREASRRFTGISVGRIADARRQMLTMLGAIAGFAVFLLAAGMWFTKTYIVRPIREIEKVTERVREGDFSCRIPIVSDDELASLANTFNEMSGEISRLLARYRELFENAADFVYTADLDGKFLAVNKAGARISGYSQEELLQMRVRDLLVPEQIDVLKKMLDRKISGGEESTVYEVEIVTKDGGRLFVENNTRLLFENGKPIAIGGAWRNVTDRKRLEEQLWTAQKLDAVGRLAGGIAHDFGNILTIINGYCALTLGTLPPKDPVRTDIEGIQRAAQRAASLIRHLLGFTSGQVYRPKVINLAASLEEMIEMLRRLIGEDIRLVTQLPPDLGSVRLDPSQLEQVIVNLVLNAKDAMPGGGTLTIEASNVDVGGNWVRVVVRDTGAGVPPEVLAHMFEPFFSTKERGTGLGLSTVRAVLKQNDGTITVESTLGQGTGFTITVPRADYVGETREELIEPKRGNEAILLVEDEKDVRILVRDMLKSYGYTVVEADDQEHALRLCSQKNVHLDALLTDVVMPGMSVPDMAARIERLKPNIKVLFMSGYAEDRFSRAGINTTEVNFLQKPVSPETLALRLREVLDSSSIAKS